MQIAESATDYRLAGFIRRLLAMGPLLGLLVAVTRVGTAVIVWAIAGQPDYYFRGWEGVWVSLTLESIGGVILGLAFGGLLTGFEVVTSRIIWLGVLSIIVVSLAGVGSLIVTGYQFSVGGPIILSLALLPESLAILAGLIAGPLLSLPAH
jgi:hypothetical protein